MSDCHWVVIYEALKFLEPQDILHAEQLCKHWRNYSRLDGVWKEQLLFSPDENDVRCVRDICREQLTQPHIFAHFNSSILKLYDLRTGTMGSIVLPRMFLSTMYGAWVSMPRKILYCGGVRGGWYVATSYLIDIRTIEVERLPDMITRRAGGGLIYTSGRVYVFGGDNDDRRGRLYGDLSVCEKLSVAAKTWSAMPDMRSCRRSFSPALWEDRVYIAGGGGADNMVEVFCIRTERFVEPCAVRLLFGDNHSSAFVLGDTLVVLGPYKEWHYDINSGKLIKRKYLMRKCMYSPGAPIYCKGSWYFGIFYDEEVWRLGADLEITLEEFHS